MIIYQELKEAFQLTIFFFSRYKEAFFQLPNIIEKIAFFSLYDNTLGFGGRPRMSEKQFQEKAEELKTGIML